MPDINIDEIIPSYDYDNLSRDDILGGEDLYAELFTIENILEQKQAIARCEQSAKKLGMLKTFKDCLKQYRVSIAQQFGTSDSKRTSFTGQPLELNCGQWIADKFGVRKEIMNINANGAVSEVVASPIPIMPTSILENIDTGIEKLKIEFFKHGKWNSVITERSKAANNNKIIDLADRGVEVTSDNAKHLVKYLSDCVSMNLEILPRYKALSRLGWIDNEFMPYDNEIKFDGEVQNKYLYESVCQSGTLEEWTEFMRPLRKNLYLRLQMASSFASPLIEKVNALPFVFHLWGGTGAGKTVGLAVASSIWGNPQKGRMWRTMDNTVNYVCNLSAFMYSLPVILDELQTIRRSNETYDKLIMRCCEGTDRGRMSYDKAQQTRTWNCAYIFSGEEPITKSNSGGGATNRVIEVECKHRVVEDGNGVIRFINEHYGCAGLEYIKGVSNEKDIKDTYNSILKELLRLDTTDKQAMAMAMLLLGDKMACKYIFKDDTPLEIEDVQKFLKTKKEVDNAERAFEFTVNLIATNWSKFRDDNTREFWGITTKDGAVLINKQVLCSELNNAGFDFNAVKAKWAKNGYLILNSQGRYFHYTKCFGVKATYIKLFISEAEQNETEGLPFE